MKTQKEIKIEILDHVSKISSKRPEGCPIGHPVLLRLSNRMFNSNHDPIHKLWKQNLTKVLIKNDFFEFDINEILIYHKNSEDMVILMQTQHDLFFVNLLQDLLVEQRNIKLKKLGI